MSQDDLYDPYERLRQEAGLGYLSERDQENVYRSAIDRLLVPDGALALGLNPEDGHNAWMMPDELRFACHLIGAPGQGKSNALKLVTTQLIDQNAKTGHGVALIDPHGEVAEYVLRHCVLHRIDPSRVIYFDLQDSEWVPVLNVLRPDQGIAFVAYSLVEAITRAFGLEFVMQNPLIAETMINASIVLLEHRHSLAETEFFGPNTPENLAIREHYLKGVSDRGVVGYWKEIAMLPPLARRTETGSAARRFNFFLRFPTLKRILGQTLPGFDFAQIMDEGKIAIFNLALHATTITDQAQRFMGSLILDQFKAAASRRRKNSALPFYLAVDEFSRFVSYDTVEALAEARGFGLRLLLAHQRIDQLMLTDQDPRLTQAVLSIPYKLIFGAGLVDDQLTLARQAYAPWVDLQKRKLEIFHKVFRPVLRMVELQHRAVAQGTADVNTESETSSDFDSIGVAGLALPGSGLFGTEPPMTHSSLSGQAAGRANTRGQAVSRSVIEGVSQQMITDHEESEELSSVQFESPEEQIFRWMQENIRQGIGGCVFMRGYKEPPQGIVLPECGGLDVSVDDLEAYRAEMRRANAGYFIRVADADNEITTRHRKLFELAPEVAIVDSRGGSGHRSRAKRKPDVRSDIAQQAPDFIATYTSLGLPEVDRLKEVRIKAWRQYDTEDWAESAMNSRIVIERVQRHVARAMSTEVGKPLPGKPRMQIVRDYLLRQGLLDEATWKMCKDLSTKQGEHAHDTVKETRERALLLLNLAETMGHFVLQRFEAWRAGRSEGGRAGGGKEGK